MIALESSLQEEVVPTESDFVNTVYSSRISTTDEEIALH